MADVPPTVSLTTLTKYVNAGESSTITSKFYEPDGTALATASIQTLTLSLVAESDGSVINSRDGDDILGANGGTVADDGDGEAELTLKLQPADNVMAGTDDNEAHVAILTWTWTDAQAVGMTGKHNFKFTVYKDLKA